MLPTLRPGDRLLVFHGVSVSAGHLVVARLPDGTVAVKRVDRIDARGLWLASDNDAEGWSSDAWDLPVPETQIIARVRLRLWPRPRPW